MKKKTKQGKSFGIISIVLSVLYMLISRIVLLNIIFAILLILSLIFSILSISKEKPKVLGIIGLVLTLIGLFLGVTYYFEPLPSKGKLLKEATILDWSTVYNIVEENAAKKEDYENKYYVYQGKIKEIKENYCMLSDYATTKTIDVYLNKEDLKKLNIDEEITVIGKLNIDMDIDDEVKLRPAILLDEQTIKDNYLLAVKEITASGLYAENYENTFYNYKYDENTYKITSYSAKGKGFETGENKLTYDNKGNLIKKERVTTLYGTDVTEYEYDNENNVIKKTEYTTNNNEIKNKKVFNITYEKDSNNNIVKEVSTNSESDYAMTYTYEYDNENRVIKENQTSKRSSYDITYEYDNYGNIKTKKSVNKEKEANWVTLRYRYGIIGKKNK